MEIPEENESRIEIPDFIGEELKKQLNERLPETISEVKLKIQDTIDGYIANGFSSNDIKIGLEHYKEVQKNVLKIINAVDRFVNLRTGAGFNKEDIELEVIKMSKAQIIDYALRVKSIKTDYSTPPRKSYDSFIYFLESLRKYSSNSHFSKIEIDSNANMPIDHGIKLLLNAVNEYQSVELYKVLTSVFFTFCYSDKLNEGLNGMKIQEQKKLLNQETEEQEEPHNQLANIIETESAQKFSLESKIFFVLGRILLDEVIYSEDNMVQLIVAESYFGLDTKGDSKLKDYPGSVLEKRLLELEEIERKSLGKLCLSYFKFFQGKNKINFEALYNYLEENYEKKKEQIDSFLEGCNFLYKITEAEILFVLQHNLESSNISTSKESVQICHRLVARGFVVAEIIDLDLQQLEYLDKNKTAENGELLRFAVENSGNFENIHKIRGIISELEDDMEYLPTDHLSRERLGVIIEGVDEGTLAYKIMNEIEIIYRDFNLSEIIRFHKTLTGGDIQGMSLINFVYEKYPKAKKTDKREHKQEIKKILEIIFHKDVRKKEITFQIIKKYGEEIVKQNPKIVDLLNFLIQFIGKSSNNIEFMLLSQEKISLEDFVEKSQDTTVMNETIGKDLAEKFGEKSNILGECYRIGSSEISLIIKIGAILNATEKNTLIDYCEELFLTDTPLPNEEQLTHIYRILVFLYSDFSVKNSFKEIIDIVKNGGISSEEISSRINILYKVIGKTINKNQIRDKNEFYEVVISFLSEGNIIGINTLQSKLSQNSIEAKNKYDMMVFGELESTVSEKEREIIINSIQEFLELFLHNFRPKAISSMGNSKNGIGSGQNSKAIKNLFEAIQKQNETSDEYIERIKAGSWKSIIGESNLHNLEGKIVIRLGERKRLFFDNLLYLGKMIENLNEGQFTDLSDLSKIYKENLQYALEQTFGIET